MCYVASRMKATGNLADIRKGYLPSVCYGCTSLNGFIRDDDRNRFLNLAQKLGDLTKLRTKQDRSCSCIPVNAVWIHEFGFHPLVSCAVELHHTEDLVDCKT